MLRIPVHCLDDAPEAARETLAAPKTLHIAASKRTGWSAPTTGVLVETLMSMKPAAVHRHSKVVASDLHAITSSRADFIAPTNSAGS